MTHAFELIAKPDADLAKLCTLAYQALDKKISEYADKSKLAMNKDHKLASCFASFAGVEPTTISGLVNSHLWFSGFLIVEDDLVTEVFSHASELAGMATPTRTRGLTAVIFSGNLNAWKVAIESALSAGEHDIQTIFSTILSSFRAAGYLPSNGGLIKR